MNPADVTHVSLVQNAKQSMKCKKYMFKSTFLHQESLPFQINTKSATWAHIANV